MSGSLSPAGRASLPPVTALFAPPSLAAQLPDLTSVARLQDRTDRILASEGAGHLVHDLPVRADGRFATIESRPWRLDAAPLAIDPAVFAWLADAITERMRRLEKVAADLYGDRHLVGERVVPAEVLAASPRYRLSAVGSAPKRWLSVYAVDLSLSAGGHWSVVQDLTDAPPGLGYALLNRSVLSRVIPDAVAAHGVAPLAPISGALRNALAAVSDAPSPRIVLFSGGLDHPSYVDHSYLAVHLGLNLAEGADLVVRQRRLWLRSLDGLEPVDVLYRRVEDPGIDPLGVAAKGAVGVPGLLQALRSGGATLANAHGTGVFEEPALHPYLEDALERMAGGDGAPHRDPGSSRSGASLSLGRPNDPARCAVSAGLLGPSATDAAFVIRMFAVNDGIQTTVLPGGTVRVLADGDDPTLPTACIAKDLWVSGPGLAPRVVPHLPQVDLGRSVPTRAADALHWMNRSAERAEAMVRVARVISSRVELDPGLVELDDGAWVRAMGAVSGSAGWPRMPELAVTDGSLEGRAYLEASRNALAEAAAIEIGTMLTEATTVREFLSTTTGRVLAHLADLRSSLLAHRASVDDFDAILADFAALAGLWNESTVGGPAWILGDIGRRIARAQVVLDLVGAVFFSPASVPSHESASGRAAIEVLLASNESLVAYRRRHRSDVEAEATLALLLTDVSNPRSLAGCLNRLVAHSVQAEWPEGQELFTAAEAALGLPPAEMIPEVRRLIRSAGLRLVERWFSAPVNPIVMGRST